MPVSVAVRKFVISTTSDSGEDQLLPFLSISLLCTIISAAQRYYQKKSVSVLEKFPNCCCSVWDCSASPQKQTLQAMSTPPLLPQHFVQEELVNIGQIFLGMWKGLMKAKGEVRHDVSWLKLHHYVLQVWMLDRHWSSWPLFLTTRFSRDFHEPVCLADCLTSYFLAARLCMQLCKYTQSLE